MEDGGQWRSKDAAAALPPDPRTLTTNRRDFRIPFAVDAGGGRLAAVRLYLSSDRGGSWTLHAQQPAGQSQAFEFHADRDGEYWFASRTVDPQGRVWPSRPLTPEVRVIVDTARPEVELDAHLDRSGDVVARWRVADPHLQRDGLKLQYRPDPAASWRDVPQPSQVTWRPGEARGELTWRPPQVRGPLQLQVAAADAAGNQTQTVRQVLAANVPAPRDAALAAAEPGRIDHRSGEADSAWPLPPAPAVPLSSRSAASADLARGPAPLAPRPPYASGPSSPPGSAPPGYAHRAPWPAPQARGPAAPANASTPPPVLGGRLRHWAEQLAPGWLNEGGTASPPAGVAAAGSAPLDPYAAALPQETWNSAGSGPPSAADAAAGGLASSPPSAPAAGAVEPGTDYSTPYDPGSFRAVRHREQRAAAAPSTGPPRMADQSVLAEPPAAPPLDEGRFRPLPVAGAGDAASPTPSSSRPLMVDSLKFALEYELHDIDPGSVSEVQLWGVDASGLWAPWGKDEDRVSPVEVQVREEGRFGFRIVVSHRNGLSSRPPAAGDDADIWVEVDQTPPAVALDSAVYGSGLTAGQLDIHWRASDRNLGPRPVSLFYGETPHGPWSPIERGLSNTGEYSWRVPPETASEFFIRIEVKDLAGNRAESRVNEPIRIDGLLPKARIRSVRE